MTLNELIIKLTELRHLHGDNLGEVVVWGDATDKAYKFPITDVVLNRRGVGDRVILSEGD